MRAVYLSKTGRKMSGTFVGLSVTGTHVEILKRRRLQMLPAAAVVLLPDSKPAKSDANALPADAQA